MLKAPLQKIL